MIAPAPLGPGLPAPLPWARDPLVLLGAACAALLHAWVFFAGPYLPYIDWSNHLGLIAILAHGDRSGADLYFERSLAPTPYLLFYALSAALAQLTSVTHAAKLCWVLSSASMVLGGAALAESTGRSPRLGLLAPLALFGFSLGYGFASFVFSMPLLLFTLAAGERYFARTESAASQAPRREALNLTLWLSLAYLGHVLIFTLAALLLGARALLFVLTRRGAPRLGTLLVLAACALPAAAWALLALLRVRGSAAPDDGPWFAFTPLSAHLARLPGDLLERGSPAHWHTMYAVAVLFGLQLFLGLFVRRPRPRGTGRFALELYATLLVLLYAFGPESLVRPLELWMLFPRVATLAALFVYLLPRVDLRSRALGATSALLALLVLTHDAGLNREHVLRFNALATRYDGVRAAIPPGARVLALSVPDPDDFLHQHPALGSLYFLHLEDGAAYTAFLFDHPLLPVHARGTPRPRAPSWREPGAFDPEQMGRDYDFLVLRGSTLLARMAGRASHEQVLEHHGWTVFRTVAPRPPPPRPT
jgi:hypothetical protein